MLQSNKPAYKLRHYTSISPALHASTSQPRSQLPQSSIIAHLPFHWGKLMLAIVLDRSGYGVGDQVHSQQGTQLRQGKQQIGQQRTLKNSTTQQQHNEN
jgi:hypothetical protein